MDQITPHKTPLTPALEPDSSQPPRQKKRDREGMKSVLSTLAILIIAPIIALTLTAFVFQSYEVDGPSMETTLQNRDRLIVLKTARTWARITGHTYIPQRGDIVIFNKNDLGNFGGSSAEKQLIKRVIGLPGERVVVKDGTITVFNKTHPQGFLPDKTLPYGGVIHVTPGNVDLVIGANEVFVCGDNRPNSLDSRSFGTIPASSIVGKLALRVYPFGKMERF